MTDKQGPTDDEIADGVRMLADELRAVGFEVTVPADALVARATALGAEHGRNGAGWVFDGNTPGAAYVQCLALDDDGAPEWDDFYGPTTAPLSGEWANGMTPDSLAEEVGLAAVSERDADDETFFALRDDICDAYEQSFYDAWRDEVLRMARYQVGAS